MADASHRFAGRVLPEEVVTLLSELVAAPSINPFGDDALQGPEYGEARVAAIVERFCRGIGMDVRLQTVLPGRANVIAHLPGRSERRLLLETHMDTVKPGSMPSPFQARVSGERLYGLGACDAKGCLTAMLLALQQVVRQGQPSASVTLAAVVDEEYAYRGVLDLLRRGLRADGGVVGEPTELEVVVAHKGCVRWRVEVKGRAAHSSRPHEGLNAIMQMRHVLNAIEEQLQPALAQRRHPLVGEPTLNVGVIRGGVQSNIVPERCWIDLDRRLLPGETVQDALSEFEAQLDALRTRIPGLLVHSEPPYVTDVPMSVPTDAPIVQALQSAAQSVMGVVRVSGVPFGTDASKLTAAGIPTIVFGPGSIRQAHTSEEFVSILEVKQAAEVLADLIWRF